MRIVACLAFVCGTALLWLLSGNTYEWMQQMDPAMAVLPEPGPDNRSVIAMLVLGVIVLAQLMLALSSKTRRDRVIAAVLAMVAIALWAWRFAC